MNLAEVKTDELASRIRVCAGIVGSGDELARKLLITRRTLENYLSGKTEPKASLLYQIAQLSNVSISWLISGNGLQNGDESQNIIQVPRNSLKLSAGTGLPIDRVKRKDTIPFTEDFFQQKLPNSTIKNLMIFDAKGDSMYPTICDGDLVMVDTSKTELQDGVFALTVNNHAMIKRVQVDFNKAIIKSDNHELYSDVELRNEELNEIQIIGKAVWKGGLF